MRKLYPFSKCILSALAMLFIILDTRTAILGVTEGIDLCIRSIIPALFPFCILSKLITSHIVGQAIPLLRPLGKICGIPSGAESTLILSFVAGYPFGAQCINDACRNNQISRNDAARMVGFCNNPGPAFIFGILGVVFQSKTVLWALLGLQICSAIFVGVLLPNKSESICIQCVKKAMTLQKALEESVRTMSHICGWVILFRLILTYCDQWLLVWTGAIPRTILISTLELSNGCISLNTLPFDGLKFILAAGALSFGGICVAMQTISVTSYIGKTLYFPGKIIQVGISVLLACGMQYLLFPREHRYPVPIWIPICCCMIIIVTISVLYRKRGRNSRSYGV